jgi:hypothetical protein
MVMVMVEPVVSREEHKTLHWTGLPKQRAQEFNISEQRAESREQRAESREQRAESRE